MEPMLTVLLGKLDWCLVYRVPSLKDEVISKVTFRKALGYFGNLRNSLKSMVLQVKPDGELLTWLPGLKRLLKIQSKIPYKSYQQSKL